jgi:hypothetical protein
VSSDDHDDYERWVSMIINGKPKEKTMAPHQERVVTEKRELDEKLVKLEAFFDTPTFRGLDLAEQGRLRLQFQVMEMYSTILGQRITAF